MTARHYRRHVIQRQVDPLAPPTGVAGLTDSAVTATAQADGVSALTFDGAAGTGSATAPPLGFTSTPVITTSASSISTTSSVAAASSSVAAASNSSSPIPLSTVIASCVGAFIGAIGLILLGVWFYKRYSKSLKHAARARKLSAAAAANPHNVRGDHQRRRSRLEPWNKLEEGDDKWEEMYQTKEIDNIAPMEKLTMFKKSTPSVRTAYTHKSEEPEPMPFNIPHPFAQYQSKDSSSDHDHNGNTRPFLGRVDTGPAMSWEEENTGNDSFMSYRSSPIGGAMSPSLAMAIPTPPATSSEPHRWESAEVVHYQEAQSAEVIDPFEDDADLRKPKKNNPFFNNQDYGPRRHSQSRSRSNSIVKPKVNKGKGRAVDNDPFFEDMPTPQPAFSSHVATPSNASSASNERAIQSLIAALDTNEEDAQNGLRVASMQPSVVSVASMYTSADEEDVSRAFPLPPSRRS